MAIWLKDKIRELDTKGEGFSWRRDKHDKDCYIFLTGRLPISKVWKSGDVWATLKGVSFSRLKDAKHDVELDLKFSLLTTIDEMDSRLQAINSEMTVDKYFSMESCVEQILRRLVYAEVARIAEDILDAQGDWRWRGPSERLANALVAVQHGSSMISVMEPRITYCGAGSSLRLNLKDAALRVSVSEQKNGFWTDPEGGRHSCSMLSWTLSDLHDQLESLIKQALPKSLQAAA